MQLKKGLLVAGAVTSVGIAGLTGLGVASAATSTSGDGGSSSLITKIAEKFNLSESDVQAVFDADRSEREAEREQHMEERLSQAVTDGDLTSAQKEAILAKYKTLQSEREADKDSMQDLTAEERKAAMEAERTALQTWADENDIPNEYLRYVMGGGGHGGPDGPGRGMPPADSAEASDNTAN
ncbi:MAG TPA: hypothetical protein VD735_06005 [Candidatus Saccharimonadales bacterium]|nr:hypothetical protein [Candidatus Saccharimonadales bacterium]